MYCGNSKKSDHFLSDVAVFCCSCLFSDFSGIILTSLYSLSHMLLYEVCVQLRVQLTIGQKLL